MIDNDVLYSHVGRRLKELRSSNKVSQETVAEVLELSRASIMNFEKGSQRISLHVLFQYCELLKVDITDVLPLLHDVTLKKSASADEAVDKVKESPTTRAILEKYLSSNKDDN